ncbi:MAG: hypothetical protein LBF22_08400 [Deltaproteobacteria bacterium]|jgi:hypothetical protein|nr:hypothetical protein [Deltaproteobacteria bacterium]
MTTSSKIIENLKNVPQAINTLAKYDEDLSNALKNVMTKLKLTFVTWESPDLTENMKDAFKIPIWDRDFFSAFTQVPQVTISNYFYKRNSTSPPEKVKTGDTIVSIEAIPNGAYSKIDWDKKPWPCVLPLEASLLYAWVHIATEDSEEDFDHLLDNIPGYPTDKEGVFVPERPNTFGWFGKFDLGAFLDDQTAFIESLDKILAEKS